MPFAVSAITALFTAGELALLPGAKVPDRLIVATQVREAAKNPRRDAYPLCKKCTPSSGPLARGHCFDGGQQFQRTS